MVIKKISLNESRALMLMNKTIDLGNLCLRIWDTSTRIDGNVFED